MISREQALSTLKRTWRTQELKFYAEFFRPKKEDGSLIKPRQGVTAYGFFRNLSINDRKVFYPSGESLKYERNISFKVDVVKGLVDGKYYYLELELEDDEKRIANPYALKIKNVFILEEDHLSPKEFIDQWFYKKGHTPQDASTIAGQLTLNELELYTHTKRFIFELIQNADDMPDGNKDVNIEIILLPNHLLFLHDGKYFDREDVKAISDAAKSTKSKNLSQTGYKGIGFKSVFTDSTRVYIKSGDYFFKFDKLEPIYRDFYRLYKGYSDSLTPKAKKEFEVEYKGKEKEYTVIDKIPWQIKPIWVEQNTISQELSSSPFLKNRQVSIALEIGESTLRQKDYHGMILGLLKEPRFLLFLRKTRGFKYNRIYDQNSEAIVDISVKDKNGIIGVYGGGDLIASYIKHAFTISINNEAFIKAGLNFQKREIEGGKTEFFDSNGNKLANIPEKLGRLDKTIITISAKIEKYAIEKLYKEDSILFNYLPTSDQRFGFPFLVNADFVSKSDREFIQIENKWNHYIFYHLGQKCIEWIAILANVTHELNGKRLFSYAKTYLNLLPDELLDETNEELASINIAFNKGLTDAIQTTRFVIDTNGDTKICDDIILDETLISKVLGNGFFKEVSKTKKELPFFVLNEQSLKKDYLNIERYKADSLLTALSNETNKTLLAKTLTKLKSEKYLDFLAWFDIFCNINDIDSEWILDLPIIRLDESIISLRESLTQSDFYFSIIRTKKLEPLLTKIGFAISEFNLDDEKVKHIKSVVLQQNSYLKTDLKLYEHISAAKDLSKLTAIEKNSLITFFESLDEVGKAKYAKALALFKSKKAGGSLKPLNSLISNNSSGLPSWLSDFVIDIDEEKALSPIFQGQLLRDKDLLEKLFCNTQTFKEVTGSVYFNNIEGFYAYLLKLLKDKPEKTKIDFSAIPCVFIAASSQFVLASTVYWPESFSKINALKYGSVKQIIETISYEQLPHSSALQIKAPFSLGGKDFKLSEITPKNNAFDVLAVNDFLDWAEENGEKDFLIHFSISKLNDKYTLSKANCTLQYYTTDQTLIDLIEASILFAKLSVYPKELYADNRSKIGLLEGVQLLKYLIENGLATSAIAKYIQDSNDAKLTLQYLELLNELQIDSSKSYSSEDSEFRILKLVTQHVSDDKEKLKSFRSKIIIDGHPLLERAISEDIFFFDKNIGLKTKLSEILPIYKDRAFPLSEIMAKFKNFNDNSSLAAILKDEGRTPIKIFKELNESKISIYNPVQTFFLLFYQKQTKIEDVLNGRKTFVEYFNNDKDLYIKSVLDFFTICIKEGNYISITDQLQFPDLKFSELIIESKYALDSELPPDWLLGWLTEGEKEEKLKYLKSLDLNDSEFPVVKLRKAMLDGEADMDAARGNLKNTTLFRNTLEWLRQKSLTGEIKLSEELLKPLYIKAAQLQIPIKETVIPVMSNIQELNYTLDIYKDKAEYHVFHDGWSDWKNEIFNHLKSKNFQVISNVLPPIYRQQLSAKTLAAKEELDITSIQNKLEEFKHRFYQTWPKKEQFPIKVYKGSNLPYQIVYDSNQIKRIEKENQAKALNYLVVSEDILDSIPKVIRGSMPLDLYADLNSHKKDFEDNSGNINYSDEELAALRKIYNEDIPEVFKKNLNLAALVSALVHLPEQGFDIDEAYINLENTHEFAQLFPVYKSNDRSVVYTIMCRSARQGLLYMTAKAWDRLDDNSILLFADLGYDTNKLFYNKQSVLDANEKSTDYQILRIETDAKVSNVDDILKGTFLEKDKIWIIFRIKENKNFDALFYNKFDADNTANNTATVRVDSSGISY